MNDQFIPPRPALAAARADLAEHAQARRLENTLDEHPAESALSQYFQILMRRRMLVLAAVATALLIALFVTLTTTKLYRATTSLEIAREATRVVDDGDVAPSGQATNQEFYQTQYGLLRSRALAELVVRKLRLAENETFLYGYSGDAPTEPVAGNRADRRAALEQRATDILIANLTVAPVRSSSLVSVSFDSADPQLSARVANAVAENFIASNLARRFESSAYARRFLEDRLAQVRARLEESERALVNYASRQRIINLDSPAQGADGTTTLPSQSLVGADLAALNTALSAAKTDRAAAEARYNQAQGGGLGVTEVLNDPAVNQLRTSRAQLSADYSRLLAQFKPDYPTMVALRQQIAEVDKQLRTQTGGVVSAVRGQYQAAVEREATLQRQVDALKDGVLDLRRRSIQYNIYQRDADTNRQLYDGLLQRYKEVGIAGGVGANNVSVVDAARPPGSPFTPNTMLNMLLGLLAGLLVGGMLAFLLEQLDESILAPHDLEQKLNLPLLGSIPRVADGVTPTEMLEDSKSPMSEAYLSVMTALRFATSHGAPRAIVITSARAEEGKSTTSLAIARNFAALGKSVVLMDGDMRNPSVHKLFGLPNTQGLSNALAGEDDVGKLINATGNGKLGVMTAGPIPPNPAELLAGQRLGEVVAKLLESVDHVVIDGPPVMGLADAPLIASNVEATVFVIAAKDTRAKAARVAIRRLIDVHAHIVGAVLTKFDARQVGYDYGYSYDYGERGAPSPAKRMFGR